MKILGNVILCCVGKVIVRTMKKGELVTTVRILIS